MSYLIIGLLLIFVVSRYLDKSIIRPSNMFVFVWLFISVLFSFKYIEYNNPDNFTYLLIFIGVISFFIGGRFSSNATKKADKFDIDIRKVLALQIITIIVYIPETIDTIGDLMAGQTLEDVRIRSGEVSESSGVIAILKNFILTPFLFLSYPITAYIFLTNKAKGRKKMLVLIFSMIIVAISVLRLGGRSPILFFLVNFFVVWYFYKNTIVISRSVKRVMLIVVSVMVSSFVYASISRGIEDLPRSFYHYFVGCIALLDNGVKSVSFHTEGIATFSSPISIIDTFWRFIGGDELPAMKLILWINNYIEETINVGVDCNMNAFYSLFFWFYLDYGIAGVVILCFLYGLLSDSIYKAAIVNRHFVTIVVFSLIVQGVVFSFIRFQFSTFYYFMAFLIIPLVIKRKQVL